MAVFQPQKVHVKYSPERTVSLAWTVLSDEFFQPLFSNVFIRATFFIPLFFVTLHWTMYLDESCLGTAGVPCSGPIRPDLVEQLVEHDFLPIA